MDSAHRMPVKQKISRYNKKPTFRPQKLENIAIALKFIEDEQIKLVNIGKNFVYILSTILKYHSNAD